MTYIIVTARQTVIGQPFSSFNSAYNEASRIFGDDPVAWIIDNVRIEENRPKV
ncbi:MAG TPA: hypothetical protein VLA28_00420 [Afifellaceae bacterium]|nr:hypothetical protein [Afifellaceae bacterium]